MKIEKISIDKLIPYVNNSRTHNEEQVSQIAASIKEFGFNNPILIDKDYGVIAGHGRLLAAKKLDLSEIPCIRLEHLTEAQKKAFIIADNKLALNAGWDEELLKLELETLDPHLVELTGFNMDEINLIFNGWESDIEIPKGDIDYGSKAVIKIEIDQKSKEFAKEIITNALDQAGIEYEF